MADAGTCAAAQLWGDFASHVLRGRLCGDRLPPARRSRPGGAALPASACGGGEGGPRKTRSVTRGGVLRLRPVLTRPPGGNEHARMRRDRLLAWAQGCIPNRDPGPDAASGLSAVAVSRGARLRGACCLSPPPHEVGLVLAGLVKLHGDVR